MLLLSSKVDDNMLKKRGLLLSLIVIMIGILVIAGTYAAFVLSVSITNGNYNYSLECFKIDYSITNDDSTSNIEGTLFQSTAPTGGLKGKVTINMNSACNKITGTGEMYIRIGDGVSSNLVKTVNAHCENATTLKTLLDYNNESDCVSNDGNIWVTNGSALKYAVYENTDIDAVPSKVGYINVSSSGSDIAIHNDFLVNETQLNLYVYVWLDGNLTDNTYESLSFSGYIHATVIQNE